MSDVAQEERAKLRKLRARRKQREHRREVWQGEDPSFGARLCRGFKLLGDRR